MRTTVTISDGLLAEARQLALRTGRSLAAVIEDALRESLGRQSAPQQGRPPLPTYRGTGLRPGVDLDDSAALIDLMNDERDPH